MLNLLSFAELRNLHYFCRRASLPDFQAFTSLRSFTLGWSNQSTELDLGNLLRRSNFPSLQALAITHLSELNLLRTLQEPSSLDLIEHLDAFFINNVHQLDVIFDALKNVLSSTLITAQVHQAVSWGSTLSQPVHLRLRNMHNAIASGICQELAKMLATPSYSSLRSLYLDASCMEAVTLQSLTGACANRKVELVYEEVPSNWTIDPVISPEFWRRQRVRRRLEENKAK